MFDVLKEEFEANTAKMQQIRAAHEKKKKGNPGRLRARENSPIPA